MPSLAGFKFTFTPSWRMSLLALFAILLFLRLGFWQLQRADEKKLMLSAHQLYEKEPPKVWHPRDPSPAQYEPLRVEGALLPEIFLLDNQHVHHQFGYQVISPLVLGDGQVVLIDRGWVAGDITRQTLPEMSTPAGRRTLIGNAYYPSKKKWQLGGVLEKKDKNKVVIENMDVAFISQFLHKSIYPFIIRLNRHEANGFFREWAIVAMPPERHYAYAIQWFAMSFVSFILFLVLNIKKVHEHSSL